ncbi:hypothetical protein ENHY17A_60006 [Moraxellaceae bacterium 17A]|nr:hypothetical protein ENHY17A_60006 [Moraxellaceae bacterium 17A]
MSFGVLAFYHTVFYDYIKFFYKNYRFWLRISFTGEVNGTVSSFSNSANAPFAETTVQRD